MTVSHLLILLVCLYLNIVIALLKIFSAFITLKTINKYSNLSIVGIKKLKSIKIYYIISSFKNMKDSGTCLRSLIANGGKGRRTR